jgi:hypothetical protein
MGHNSVFKNHIRTRDRCSPSKALPQMRQRNGVTHSPAWDADTGQQFWDCKGYPECESTRALGYENEGVAVCGGLICDGNN